MHKVTTNFIVLIMVFSTSSLAIGSQFNISELDRLAPEIGLTRLNNQEEQASVFNKINSVDGFISSLKSTLKNKYTVTVSDSGLSKVIIISKVYSEQCLQCPKLTPNNMKDMISLSYVISIFQLKEGQSFAIGTYGKSLMGIKQSKYTGSLLRNSKKILGDVTFTEYLFDRYYTSTLSALVEISPSDSAKSIYLDLRKQGYLPFEGSSKENYFDPDKTKFKFTLIKRSSTVHVVITSTPSKETSISINESITH